MNEPIPFATNADEAEHELRPLLEAHAERLGGSLLEFWPADPCVHRVRSADHERFWSEAWFWAEYKLSELNDYGDYGFGDDLNDLVDLRLWRVLPLDAHAVRIRFEVCVVVSEE